MVVRLISWVLIFLSNFVILRAWIAVSDVLSQLLRKGCVIVLSIFISCSALFTTIPTSVIEAVIRSRVLCSNFDTVVCTVVCILGSHCSTKFTVFCSLLMVAVVLC